MSSSASSSSKWRDYGGPALVCTLAAMGLASVVHRARRTGKGKKEGTIAGLMHLASATISRQESRETKLSREQTKEVLYRLALTFHAKCREFAEMSYSVRENLQAKGMVFPEEQLKEQLAQQSGAMDKLGELQTNFLAGENISAEDLEEAQEAYSEHEDIFELTECYAKMLDDSLAGLLPLMPFSRPPSFADGDALLDVLKQINEREIVEVCRHFRESGGVLHSVQHLGEVITKARHATEQEIIQKMAGVSVETFYSNIGHLDRTSYNFLSDRKKLARVHRIRLAQLFMPVDAGDGESAGDSISLTTQSAAAFTA